MSLGKIKHLCGVEEQEGLFPSIWETEYITLKRQLKETHKI